MTTKKQKQITQTKHSYTVQEFALLCSTILHNLSILTEPFDPRIEGIQLGSRNWPPPELLTYELESDDPFDIDIRDKGGLRFLLRSESRFMLSQCHQVKACVMTRVLL